MPAEKQRRRRAVASCTQCYSKKQKCNHQYPCNHCLRRRLPELCSYASNTPDGDNSQKVQPNTVAQHKTSPPPRQTSQPCPAPSPVPGPKTSHKPSNGGSSWLGFFGDDTSFLFTLLQKELDAASHGITPEDVMNDIRSAIQLLPKRFMVDRLVQHFIKEVNWIYQTIHPTTFLNRYEKWWKAMPGLTLESLEFCVLVLRICAYTAQFIAPEGEGLYGVPQASICTHCHRLATRLSNAIQQMPAAKSLVGVQELFLGACYLKNDGRAKEAWSAVGNAIRLAQDLGMHKDTPGPTWAQMSEFERDLRRRTFCNLFLLDRFLAAVLDRLPCIPDEYCNMQLPTLRLVADEDPDMPDEFQERILQTRFTQLAFQMLASNKRYDANFAEEQYENIRRNFVLVLPAAFYLNNPNTKWDEKLPFLPRQRLALRMAVFFVLCQLFKPLLELTTAEIESMVQYKRNLLMNHRNHMVHSALSLLESCAELHRLMGGTNMSFFQLIYQTYEATMILALHLVSHETALSAVSSARAQDVRNDIFTTRLQGGDPLLSSYGGSAVDMAHCRAQIDASLNRLTLLAEASSVAQVAARNIRGVINKLDALQSQNKAAASCRDAQSNDSVGHLPNPELGEQSSDADNWYGFKLASDIRISPPPFDGSVFIDGANINWADIPTTDTQMINDIDLSRSDVDCFASPWVPVDLFSGTSSVRSRTPSNSAFTSSSSSGNFTSPFSFYQMSNVGE